MEAVASGMAVASLSIQLIQSVGTTKAFIRDVKGASKELERLAELLDRLNALLEDVRAVMERQTSLQGQHFPAPSMTIFDCLKSCEASLRVLQGVVEKYKRDAAENTSRMTKLKDDIRFGFRAKDIVGFETRIQRDINYLHAALGLNSANIL
jgi:heme exporter protein D